MATKIIKAQIKIKTLKPIAEYQFGRPHTSRQLTIPCIRAYKKHRGDRFC